MVRITSRADLPGIFGVRVDRNAAAVVADRQPIALVERDFDSAGVAGNRFVHRVVDDLGGQVMERASIGTADVHAGPTADGLQALEDLDGGSVIIVGRCGRTGSEEIGHFQNAIGCRQSPLPSQAKAEIRTTRQAVCPARNARNPAREVIAPEENEDSGRPPAGEILRPVDHPDRDDELNRGDDAQVAGRTARTRSQGPPRPARRWRNGARMSGRQKAELPHERLELVHAHGVQNIVVTSGRAGTAR